MTSNPFNKNNYILENRIYDDEGFFDDSIDITFIITLHNNEDNKRLENINQQLTEFIPTQNIKIYYNKPFIEQDKYHSDGTIIDSTSKDLLNAYMNIFEISKNYNNILILEDDFKFSDEILIEKNSKEINNFINTFKPELYYLGIIPIIINPLYMFNTHIKFLYSVGTHSVIYSNQCRDKLLNLYSSKNYIQDFDYLVNFNISNKYFNKYPYCIQIFEETENKKNWINSINLFNKNKLYDFFVNCYIKFMNFVIKLYNIDLNDKFIFYNFKKLYFITKLIHFCLTIIIIYILYIIF